MDAYRSLLSCRYLAVAAILALAQGGVRGAPTAAEILSATGIQGGVVCHVGCGDGRLTASLRATDRYLVHGLETAPDAVAVARETLRSLGLYGPVCVDSWSGRELPYIDDFVNLLVAEDPGALSRKEILRVLVPEGRAYVKVGDAWQVWTKPRPGEMDEWTHYLHGPGNNAVSHDRRIAPVGQYQWVAGPRYSRHHDHMSSVAAVVSSGGRVFEIIDLAPAASILLPSSWHLVARDAFNGTLLWRRAIPSWHTRLWPLKSGPQSMARRLVAVGERVYVTLGVDAPVCVLDAATGETLATFEETRATEEILLDGDTLLAVAAGTGQPLRSDPAKTYAGLAEARADVTHSLWSLAPRTVFALDARTGAVRWSHATPVVPMSLTAGGGHVLFHDGVGIRCLRGTTGETEWTSAPLPRRESMRSSGGATLVLYDDVVFYSGQVAAEKYEEGRSTTLFALDAADGRELWRAEHPPCGHMGTPDDILVANGLVWCGAVAQGTDSGVMIGRDPRLGKVCRQFTPDVQTHWFHHRCYRAKATDRYLLFSRTGIEFIDTETEHWTPHHWVRGACNYGIMPANGLIYAPQHPCACYLEAKLFGLSALAPAAPEGGPAIEVDATDRLQRGPAYGMAPAPDDAPASPEDWPTYRHDPARSGAAMTGVPSGELGCLWERPLPAPVSAVTVARGRVFAASIDTHAVYALDAATGEVAWSYTAGGRVDSPPTAWEGRVLFGSADGRITCLRAADGVLVWSFRGAPRDRRMGAWDQIESVWPISGSVLVQKGVATCVAGRSMFLDGGLRLLRLDAATGELLSETVLDDRDPQTQENLQSHIEGLNMPVALPDILSSDGQYVYMHSLPFDLEGRRAFVRYVPVREQQGDDVHLFTPTGFLDDALWHRSYWVYGRAWASGAGGYYQAGRLAPAGRLLVFDDTTVYGYGRLWQYYRWSTPLEYHFFAADKQPEVVRAGTERKPVKRGGKRTGTSRSLPVTRFVSRWSGETSVQVTAMALTREALFAAGPRDCVNEEEAVRSLSAAGVGEALQEQEEAFLGRRGAFLAAVSPRTGGLLAGYRLDGLPVFDGLAAANGRLYLAMMDGRVCCYGSGSGKPLAPAVDVTLEARPPDPILEEGAGAGSTPEDGEEEGAGKGAQRGDGETAQARTSAADAFAAVTGARVWRTEDGFLLEAREGETGYALRQLDAPLTGTARLTVALNMRPAAATGRGRLDGFLVLGSGTDPKALVHCGVLQRQGKATVMLGTGKTARKVEAKVPVDTAMRIVVTVDTADGSVAMRVGDETLELALGAALPRITYVGYAVIDAVTEFGPVQTEIP
ncbi:MAG: PQQ-binding-like beta-propeller repeat protein [Lentisphaeria bacterium]|nr:PQQ-binding-like beta-propeller repeat protein [Lentisphaeria bacterium]